MSTPNIGEASTPVGSPSASKEVADFFHRIAESDTQARLRTATGICQFDIEGAGTWRLTIKKGVATVTRGDDGGKPPANCVISCSAADFVRIVRHEGNMNVFTAVLQELVTITGDIPFAWSVLASFTLKPADARPR